MQIEIPDDVRYQAVAAGFASVEDYVAVLLRRDAERVAIREGLRAIEEGRVRPIEEFERDFRQSNHLTPRA